MGPRVLTLRRDDAIAAAVAGKAPPLRCPQCGAPIRPVEEDPFLSCSFCGSNIFLDAGRAIRHFIVEPTLDAGMATSALSRWLKDREVVGRASPVSSELVFFPLWQVTSKERNSIIPAAGALYEGLDRIEIPSGDLKVFAIDRAEGPRGEKVRVIEASVPLMAALSRGAAGSAGHPESRIASRTALPGGRAGAIAQPDLLDVEARLIHVPLHLVEYEYHGTRYTAAVDACSGRLYPITAPRSSENRIDGAFALLLGAGLVLNLIALALLPRAPFFSLALLGAIGWGLYRAGLRIARWMES